MKKLYLPPFDRFPEISDHKVTLRAIRTEDLTDLFEITYYDGIPANSIRQSAEIHARIHEDYLAGNSIHWGIIENDTQKIVGTCGYYRGFESAAGELGCVLLPAYRGHGYMTSAMRLAVEFGLHTMGLKRIWARTNQQNTKAILLLQRLDFAKINTLDNGFIDFELNRLASEGNT